MTPRFDLFVVTGEVWQNDGQNEQPYAGPWPVQVWFTSCDCLDGNGWHRDVFERHGTIVRHFAHDVGRDDATEAVLVEVSTAQDLVALVRAGFELCDSEPKPLWAWPG
jgi:hypothetical protein